MLPTPACAATGHVRRPGGRVAARRCRRRRPLLQLRLRGAGCSVQQAADRSVLSRVFRRVATHILAFEGDSKVTWFEGGWSDYEEARRKVRAPTARPGADTVRSAAPQKRPLLLVCSLGVSTALQRVMAGAAS